ncbi:hypothetical protein EK904_010733 [Melospiza melodia maxima]|nr:hypothetical protein EK904_010733 [Melospiza melodia maxima]
MVLEHGWQLKPLPMLQSLHVNDDQAQPVVALEEEEEEEGTGQGLRWGLTQRMFPKGSVLSKGRRGKEQLSESTSRRKAVPPSRSHRHPESVKLSIENNFLCPGNKKQCLRATLLNYLLVTHCPVNMVDTQTPLQVILGSFCKPYKAKLALYGLDNLNSLTRNYEKVCSGQALLVLLLKPVVLLGQRLPTLHCLHVELGTQWNSEV